MPRIAVVGAGPAGLTFALACARHEKQLVDITIFEREEDHMTSDRYNPDRSYTIDITGHGLKALQYCEATKVRPISGSSPAGLAHVETSAEPCRQRSTSTLAG